MEEAPRCPRQATHLLCPCSGSDGIDSGACRFMWPYSRPDKGAEQALCMEGAGTKLPHVTHHRLVRTYALGLGRCHHACLRGPKQFA